MTRRGGSITLVCMASKRLLIRGPFWLARAGGPKKIGNVAAGSALISPALDCQKVDPGSLLPWAASFSSLPSGPRDAVLGGGHSAVATPTLLQQVLVGVTGVRHFSAKDLPSHQVIDMPSLSPTMEKGNIAEWLKKEGDKVSPGDVLARIETDKSTMDLESLEEGFIAKIILPGGSQDIPVGVPILVMAEEEGDIAAFEDYAPAGAAPTAAAKTSAEPAATGGERQATSGQTSPAPPPPDRIGPSARKLILESGINWTQIQATGPKGMLTKGDVLDAIARGPTATSASTSAPKATSAPAQPSAPKAPAPSAPIPFAASDSFEDVANTNIRRIIAKRLLESKIGTPHLYLTADVELDAALAFRKEIKKAHSVNVSVNDFVIRAAALALRSVPEANASWDEARGEITANPDVDIAIAVATDKGLITPILRAADQKSLAATAAEVRSLAEKARAGKLKPEEFTGGSFTISNLGMFGTDNFSAIINPPQACIMAVGGGKKVAVWKSNKPPAEDEDEDEGGDEDGELAFVTKMNVTLSADHRVYDGEIAGKFLSNFRYNLANPEILGIL